VLARIAPQAGRVLLSANGDPARFAAFGLPVVADAVPDMGPLAGIAAAASALSVLEEPPAYLLSVPVDTPLVPDDLVARLLAASAAAGGVPAVAAAGGRVHWTAALWPLAEALWLTEAIRARGLRRVQEALERAGAVTAEFQDATAFLNVNRPEDVKTLTGFLTPN
jgi:molybdopterin-guanine dinucleotide biosynthesis protein A